MNGPVKPLGLSVSWVCVRGHSFTKTCLERSLEANSRKTKSCFVLRTGAPRNSPVVSIIAGVTRSLSYLPEQNEQLFEVGTNEI